MDPLKLCRDLVFIIDLKIVEIMQMKRTVLKIHYCVLKTSLFVKEGIGAFSSY